ncbi:helix-turn-helix domain-containing protein [Subdoligranulum variabile]|uniref:helix-turn-helix domain-containing protein n=1 Tax=Subdoligranulum variabile TaxID=214851 RepID=UPI00294228C6|nr:helix-turn-helix domain-containing protein [Subdoligranulum variabile]
MDPALCNGFFEKNQLLKILVLNAKEVLHLFRIIFYRKRGAEVREYRYLTHDDRLLIEKLYAHGITPSSIAGVVGVSLATIYRELPRGYTGKRYPGGRKVYSAEKAQQTTNQNIKRRGRTPADRKDATK